jgi:hypothetical protein
MFIIRLGDRTVNLRHFIATQELRDPASTIRMTLPEGLTWDFVGPDADKLRRRLDRLDPPVPADAEMAADPEPGEAPGPTEDLDVSHRLVPLGAPDPAAIPGSAGAGLRGG